MCFYGKHDDRLLGNYGAKRNTTLQMFICESQVASGARVNVLLCTNIIKYYNKILLPPIKTMKCVLCRTVLYQHYSPSTAYDGLLQLKSSLERSSDAISGIHGTNNHHSE